MRRRVSPAWLLVLGSIVPFAAGPGHAQEHVSMPFACSVHAGQVRIAPAATDTLYPIIGIREQQRFLACTSAPAECRTLTLHRFDFDCGGQRLDWMSFVAAAGERQPWWASVDAGRLMVRLLRSQPSAANPCTTPAGSASAIPRRGPPMTPAQPCAKPGDDPGARVAFPPGFAPVLYLRARFSGGETPPRTPGLELVRTGVAGAGAADKAAAGTADSRPQSPLQSGASSPGAGQRPGASARAVEASSSAAAEPSSRVDGWVATVRRSNFESGAWRHLAVALAFLSLAVIGSLFLFAKATATSQRREAAGTATEAGAEPASSSTTEGEATVSSSDAVGLLAAALMGSEAGRTPLDEPDRARSREATEWAAAAELKATAEALSGIVRQIIEDLLPYGALRDVLQAELAGIDQRLSSPELATALRNRDHATARSELERIVNDLQRVRTLARIEHERGLGERSRIDAMPETPDEAYTFLGVNPSASERVVKKAVDALRQNWHPDQATDDDDRLRREARMKQINTAWDQIRAQPARAD